MKYSTIFSSLFFTLLMGFTSTGIAQSEQAHRDEGVLKIVKSPATPRTTQIYTWENGEWVLEHEEIEQQRNSHSWDIRNPIAKLRNCWNRATQRWRSEWEKMHPQRTGALPEGVFAYLSNNPQEKELTVGISLEQPAHVTIDILRHNGEVVATLANQEFSTGRHHFLWEASEVKNGNYRIRHIVDGKTLIQRIIVRRNYVGT